MTRLLTDQQLCDTFGIPSPRTVRTMRQQGLPAVRIGKAFLFDEADVEAFIAAKKETSCRAPTKGHPSNGLPTVESTTSSGSSMARAACVLQAQATSAKLKRRCQPTSGQVIALQPARASRQR